MEPKTDYRRLPSTRATALFSYYDISVGHAACLTTKRAGRKSNLVALIVLRKGIRLKQNTLAQLMHRVEGHMSGNEHAVLEELDRNSSGH